MTRRFELTADRGRDQAPQRPTSPACEAELQRILSSRVFNGGHVRVGGMSLRFAGSRTHKETLERVVRAYLDGRTPTTLDVTAGKPRTQKYVHVTIARLSDRLAEYYQYEGANNPTRIDVSVRQNVIYLECCSPSLQPCQTEYERALYHVNRQSPDHIEKAREHIERALALNEKDAASHALYSEVLLLEAMHTFTAATAPLRRRALDAARRAVALDASLWRAHAALGGVCEWDLDFAGARTAFTAALELDGFGLWDYEAYYGFVVATGEMEHAVRLAEAFQRDRPADPIAHRTYAACLHITGRQAEAERALCQAMRLDPGLWLTAITLVLVYLATGRSAEALGCIEPLVRVEPKAWPGVYMVCLSAAGRRQQARRELETLRKRAEREYVQPIQLALGHMALGDLDQGIGYLAASGDERHPMMDWVHRWPILEPFRAHPGYRPLLKRLNIPVR